MPVCLAAEGCSFGTATPCSGGCRNKDRQDYVRINPRRGYEAEDEVEDQVDENDSEWTRDRKKRHYKHRHQRRHHRHHRDGHYGWRDREMDPSQLDPAQPGPGRPQDRLQGLLHVVAKKGLEDQIDPKIVESLRNGLLSKTAFGKGVEKGYLAGKNGVEQNGRG